VLATAVLVATQVLAFQPGTVFAEDLVITSDVHFSALDGSAQDEDGVVDGVLTVRKLSVFDAHLIIDVPMARFIVEKHVLLHRALVGPALTPQIGPTIVVEAGQHIFVSLDAAVVADGYQAGGEIRLCSGQQIHMRRGGIVSADAFGPDSRGGSILFQAVDKIQLHRRQHYVRANGASGGSIQMISCLSNNDDDDDSDSENSSDSDSDSGRRHIHADSDSDSGDDDSGGSSNYSILIQGGAVQANGSDSVGGTVSLLATHGSIRVSGSSTAIEAIGAPSPGTIVMTANARIVLSASTSPAAELLPDTPSDATCDSCPGDPPQGDCVTDLECDDGNTCTSDTCVSGACQNTNNAESCDDGLFCTPDDGCFGGVCAGSGDACPGQLCDEVNDVCVDCFTELECDDSNPCTTDACVSGACQNTNNTVPCDDGLFCTADDACSGGVCSGSGDACPAQQCDEVNDVCVDCFTSLECDDSNACTTDACVSGACQNTNNTAPCDDGLFCTADDACSGGVCSGSGDACPAQQCDEVNDVCVDCFTSLECDDSNACTTDACVSGACQNTNNTAPCDDGLFCTADDICSGGACIGSGDACPGQFCDEVNDICVDCFTELDCDDSNPCTTDACVSGACQNTNSTAPCDDGLFCTADDVCSGGACVGSGDACPGQTCDEAANACTGCLDDAECDDAHPCTTDTCVGGACQNTNNTAPCDDGLFCTANDLCVDGVCVGSGDACPDQLCDEASNLCVDCLTAVECDDSNPCTTDACAAGVCQNDNNTASCDDGLFCTADDICAGGACVGSGETCPGQTCNEANDTCVSCVIGTDCDDSNPCTTDACISGTCHNDNNTAVCDDGLFCTAVDLCSAGLCVGAGDPCSGLPCDENQDLCGIFPPPPPVLDPHVAATADPTITITGTALLAAQVREDGNGDSQFVPVANDMFGAVVPLHQNAVNTLYFTSIGANGLSSAPATTFITHDNEPPILFIDVPADGEQISTPTTDVAGRVGDILSGFMGLTVSVNGIAAIVDVGIGNNGTFLAHNVPLLDGQPTVIVATATDALGNSTQEQVIVTRTPIPAGVPYMEVVSGNGQSGPIHSLLPQPIVVRLFRGNGDPFANKIVTFDVTRSNGRLTSDGSNPGRMKYQVHADANGLAQARWQLGNDAGCGNNRVVVSSRDILGTAVFCASATHASAKQINVGSGGDQRCEAGAPATEPLRAWVSDGCNGVPNELVTFSVLSGSGHFDGQPTISVLTSMTGHAQANFTAGDQLGMNVVQATFPGNVGQPAEFDVLGVPRDPGVATSFYGVVLDNANMPIGGATCTLVVNQQGSITTSDENGVFIFDNISAGPADLYINGGAADTLGGTPIPQGSFPFLHFMPVLVPNIANCLPTQVFLPRLNPDNAVTFDNTCDVELTVEGIEGLKMIVARGSMARADGSVPSPSDPAVLTLNQVHVDAIPMPMPDGASPPFAWTLQPAGATFDPPVRIVFPNMSGLPAGTISYFLSFNHDTNRFEIIATGSVNEDGSSIESDPGSGIATAGWGGLCPPYPPPGDVEKEETCPEIQIDSLTPSDTLPLSTDLAVQYTISGGNLDQASFEISAADNTVVYADTTISTTAGTHTVIWPDGIWNQGSTAFANPLNGPYLVTVSGAKGMCFPNAAGSIATSLEISADVTDVPPVGSSAAGVADMLDALKVVLRVGQSEFEFSGADIMTSAITNGLRITINDPLLNALPSGIIEVVFKNLRDEVGNFADDDADLSNGAETVSGTLELQ
jgi:hypothetical protein